MFATIQEKLIEIEAKEHVRILHCVESGSRAWGFASPDSDYDVRFIYVRRPEDYLRLEKTRDVIEWQLDDELDINGWDLQKALRLLRKSNPALFEWNNSPIVYKTTSEWNKIGNRINQFFKPHTGVFHYFCMANGNYQRFLRRDAVKLKKYFYTLRPILACRWIMLKQLPPPVLFTDLIEACLPEHLKPDVYRLIDIKQQSGETDYGPRSDALNRYIDGSVVEIKDALRNMPRDETTDWNELNQIFLEQVFQNRQ